MPAPSFRQCCVVPSENAFHARMMRPPTECQLPAPASSVQLPHSILGALPIWTMAINLFLVWMIPKNLETMPLGSQGSHVQLPNDTSN